MVIRGTPLKLGCEEPLRVRVSVMGGRALARVMVCAPPPAMLKRTVSAPGVLLAAMMASRSEMASSAPGSNSSAPTLEVSPSAVSEVVITSNAPRGAHAGRLER